MNEATQQPLPPEIPQGQAVPNYALYGTIGGHESKSVGWVSNITHFLRSLERRTLLLLLAMVGATAIAIGITRAGPDLSPVAAIVSGTVAVSVLGLGAIVALTERGNHRGKAEESGQYEASNPRLA